MKKRILSILIIFALLAGVSAATATAGGSDDPLVSLSHAKSWADGVVSAASAKAKTELSNFGSTAIQSSKNYGVSYPKSYTLTAGSTMTLGTGCSLVLTSGSARVSIAKGTLVNATAGTAASSGSLNLNQQYIVCEDSTVTVTATVSSVVVASGKVSSDSKASFADVLPEHWFYPYVTRGVELGLIHGLTETTYAPDRTLSVAEAITLAAQIHRLDQTGSTSIPPAAGVWYETYRSYCISNGIIDGKYADYSDSQMNAAITRGEFVHIFYYALPESNYAELNQIADNTIPDVTTSDAYANEIYVFYRAGILGGYTNTAGYADHAFGTSSNIRRSEVAVIVVHMMDADTRISFTI